MVYKTGKDIVDAIQAVIRGKFSHVSVAGQEWVRLWDNKVQLPEGTHVIGPNTATTTGASEYNPSRYGCDFDDPSQAARIVIWFKSWDEATKFRNSINIEGNNDEAT